MRPPIPSVRPVQPVPRVRPAHARGATILAAVAAAAAGPVAPAAAQDPEVELGVVLGWRPGADRADELVAGVRLHLFGVRSDEGAAGGVATLEWSLPRGGPGLGRFDGLGIGAVGVLDVGGAGHVGTALLFPLLPLPRHHPRARQGIRLAAELLAGLHAEEVGVTAVLRRSLPVSDPGPCEEPYCLPVRLLLPFWGATASWRTGGDDDPADRLEPPPFVRRD